MFGGEYKSKPKVSLGGKSKKEKRSSLIHRNQTEREKREEHRRQIVSALKIQAFLRGHWIRQREYDVRREDFDAILVKLKASQHPDIDTIHLLLSYLLFFYSNSKDSERLISMCQLLLKNSKNLTVLDHKRWTFQIKQFLCLCSRNLKEAVETKRAFAIPLRTLEVFTSPTWYDQMTECNREEHATSVSMHLAKNGYFNQLRFVLEERIPSSLESGSSTPLADSLIDLMTRPIRQICSSSRDNERFALLCSFAETVFVPKLSDQVRNCLLPKLKDPEVFPFKDLLQCLKNTEYTSSAYLLYSVLELAQSNAETLKSSDMPLYLETILHILKKLPPKVEKSEVQEEFEDSDDELASSSSQMQQDSQENDDLEEICESCFELLNTRSHVKLLLTPIESRSLEIKPSEYCVRLLSLIVSSLVFDQKCRIHKSRLLLTLSFNRCFFKKLWKMINQVSLQSSMGKQISLLQMVIHGNNLRNWEAECIAPLLAVFCFLLANLLFSLHDIDFHSQDSGAKIPFTLEELSDMSRTLCEATLGVIDIMNREIRTTTVPNYDLRSKVAKVRLAETLENEMYSKDKWNEVLEAMTRVIKQLHSRDTRLHYCPADHWLSSKIELQVDLIDLDLFFQDEGTLDPADFLHGMPGKTFCHVAILEHIPFVVPFVDRVKLFQRILSQDKVRNVGSMHNFLMGPSIEVRIRRSSLYQDAFDELSGDQDLKQKIHVQLINVQGLEEAGVDGGGLFREFLNECLKAGFDKNIGFFSSTNNELLYPNPQAHLVERNVFKHYYFLGKMLGKAIYENMLVELPFASFFLCKLLSPSNADVDINHLESLDPEVYRNLLYLKDCPDVEDLALNFTVVNNDLGESEVVELKPGGRDIVVTNQNRIEYIHLMADYRLNKQIRPHCNAFRSGLSSVIDISWLRMFDPNELQMLISGAQVPIDIEDLKSHTSYSGDFNEQHPCVQNFWSVVLSFDDNQRRQLLKFVTSCSRPPLLGFKDLYPPFTIHNAGAEDRLPSASTCVNLLKLPAYPDRETMRQRLLYSIESGAGFELS